MEKGLKNNYKSLTIRVLIVLGIFVVYGFSHVFLYLKGTLLVFSIFIIGLFIFNLIVRRFLYFKPYFISKYNVFSETFRTTVHLNIASELMFDKILEVMGETKFKLVEVDFEKQSILCLSKITLTSWGENIYIAFEDSDKGSQMIFYSVSILGMYSENRHRNNYTHLMNVLDKSLII